MIHAHDSSFHFYKSKEDGQTKMWENPKLVA